MENIQEDLKYIKKNLIVNQNKSQLFIELHDRIISEDCYISSSNIVDTEHSIQIYSTRMKINIKNPNIFGISETVNEMKKANDSKLKIYTIVFKICSFTIFTNTASTSLIGVIKSSNLNSEKFANLNMSYSEMQLESDFFKISNGKIVNY